MEAQKIASAMPNCRPRREGVGRRAREERQGRVKSVGEPLRHATRDQARPTAAHLPKDPRGCAERKSAPRRESRSAERVPPSSHPKDPAREHPFLGDIALFFPITMVVFLCLRLPLDSPQPGACENVAGAHVLGLSRSRSWSLLFGHCQSITVAPSVSLSHSVSGFTVFSVYRFAALLYDCFSSSLCPYLPCSRHCSLCSYQYLLLFCCLGVVGVLVFGSSSFLVSRPIPFCCSSRRSCAASGDLGLSSMLRSLSSFTS